MVLFVLAAVVPVLGIAAIVVADWIRTLRRPWRLAVAGIVCIEYAVVALLFVRAVRLVEQPGARDQLNAGRARSASAGP